MRISLLSLVLATLMLGACNSGLTKGQEINRCMEAGGSPEECDRKVNQQRRSGSAY